jgi:hypothetical protein
VYSTNTALWGSVNKIVVIDVRISGLLLADEIITLDPRFIVKLNPQLTSNNAD